MARYRRHPGCQAVFALVYDPGGLISNPEGLEHDLQSSGTDVPFRLAIVGR